MTILKIRPAWSGAKGKGGAIISIPSDIRKESGFNVGDDISMKVENKKIVLSKIVVE